MGLSAYETKVDIQEKKLSIVRVSGCAKEKFIKNVMHDEFEIFLVILVSVTLQNF